MKNFNQWNEVKKSIYYFDFVFKADKKSVALLSQIKLFDCKRLDRKIGKINEEDFKKLKEKLFEIM